MRSIDTAAKHNINEQTLYNLSLQSKKPPSLSMETEHNASDSENHARRRGKHSTSQNTTKDWNTNRKNLQNAL